jgi:hypothetical protein
MTVRKEQREKLTKLGYAVYRSGARDKPYYWVLEGGKCRDRSTAIFNKTEAWADAVRHSKG